MKRLSFEPSKFIFRKGDAANGVYLVISGQVGIFLPSNATKEPDFVVRENELFGEMGVVSDQSRMANAATLTDCDLLLYRGMNLKKCWTTRILWSKVSCAFFPNVLEQHKCQKNSPFRSPISGLQWWGLF